MFIPLALDQSWLSLIWSWIKTKNHMEMSLHRPGPVFCLLLGVSSDYARPITGQVTEVTCPVIGQAQPEHTLSKRQKTGPVLPMVTSSQPDTLTIAIPSVHIRCLLVWIAVIDTIGWIGSLREFLLKDFLSTNVILSSILFKILKGEPLW